MHGRRMSGLVLLVLGLAVQEEESAASRACHLAATRSGGPGRLVPGVDHGVRDPVGQLPLGEPGSVQQPAHRVDVAADQVVTQRQRRVPDLVQRLHDIAAVAVALAPLFVEDLA